VPLEGAAPRDCGVKALRVARERLLLSICWGGCLIQFLWKYLYVFRTAAWCTSVFKNQRFGSRRLFVFCRSSGGRSLCRVISWAFSEVRAAISMSPALLLSSYERFTVITQGGDVFR